jgi:hypothetical protein
VHESPSLPRPPRSTIAAAGADRRPFAARRLSRRLVADWLGRLQLQLAEGLALVTLGPTAHSPHLVFREDALPIGAVVVIVIDVAVARLTAFGCNRVVGRYLRHAGFQFVD